MKEMVMTWQNWLDAVKKELETKGWAFPNQHFDHACMRALDGIAKMQSAPAGVPFIPPARQTPNAPICSHLS